MECLFWRRDKMPYIGRRLLKVITDKQLDEHPIIFHIFSNGGAILYQHVSLAMQQANTPLKVKKDGLPPPPFSPPLSSLTRADVTSSTTICRFFFLFDAPRSILASNVTGANRPRPL